jgi:hypothetical protein
LVLFVLRKEEINMHSLTIEIHEFDGWYKVDVYDAVTGELLIERGEDTLQHAIVRALEHVVPDSVELTI